MLQVMNAKPAPDIFLAAAAALLPGVQPGDCLVFEDAPTGVAAAVAAEMPCIMVPDARMPASGRVGAAQVRHRCVCCALCCWRDALCRADTCQAAPDRVGASGRSTHALLPFGCAGC